MKTRFHKLTAWLLTLAMLMTFIPTFSQMGTGLTVYATEGTGLDSDDSELGGGTGDEAGSGGSLGTEGDTVALTVTPDDGFEIDTVSYNDGTNDNEITPDDGVYSFIMPASDVTVSAVFEEAVDTVLPVAAVTTTDNVTTEYSDIQFAIDAAEASTGSTLKLLEDVDTHVLIEGGTFTLDLNGHNIEADTLFDGSFLSRAYALTILNDANITLEGSGSIISNCILDNSSTTFCYCIYNRGNLKIDGDIELKTNEYRFNSGIYNTSGGQLTIDNCSINARLYAIACYESNTTINGGNFQAKGTCLDIDNANVTVKGGSFTGEGYDCYVYASSNSSTVKLGVGDDGSGPIFPGGIIVSNTVGLSDLLDENCYFKQNGTSVDMTNITTEITGDVSVAYCDHSKNINTIPTADDESTHSLFCSDCGAIVSHGNHSLDGGICTDCGYGCSHSSCITENNVTKCAQCPVVLVARVGDAYFAKLSDAVAAANDTNGSTLTLLADVKGDFTVDASSVFTLDLNGKTLRGTGHGSIITISTIAELTIKSSVSGGKITGCDNQTVNGTIFVYGTLKLESGEITGNSVEYGGGVVVSDGTFVMNGGEITGNTAKNYGGGVYIISNGSFTMNGGSISDNVVRIDDKNMKYEGLYGGGGVFIRQGTFTMNGGTISANRSVYTRGGGVQVTGLGTFIMNGGSVTGNSALEKGGGVYVMNGWDSEPAGLFTIDGNSVISGNMVNGDANNVYLEAPLSIGSNLSTTAGIGITGSTTPTDTGLEIASSGATEINKSAFISDNINYSIVQNDGKLYLYPHIHSWNYELDDTNTNTINATCTPACLETGTKTIVISASDKVYDGTPVIATVTNNVDGTDYSESIVYEAKTGTLTEGKPVNAGTYTASITIGEATARVEFTIEKKSIDGANIAAFDVMTYSGQPQTPSATVTIDGHTVTGTWSTVTNAYDKTTFTANGNFTGTIADKETGMAKADPTYTEPTAKTGLVYNGSAQELLNPGTAEGGTMKYYIGGTQATEEVPTRIPAGEYTVNCIIAGDENHNNIVVGEYTVTIAKKTIHNVIPLTAPVKNKVPQTEITAPGYTATVVWSPEVADKFEYNTQYTATVTITHDDNHTVTGIAENGYSFEGAKTISNAENSNVVTVSYEKTGSRPSSGGGGGSSGTSTTTTKNEDGSTTKTTTNKATGTVTEVTTNTDGSTTTVETQKDGTVTTTEKDKDGSEKVTENRADGTTVITEKDTDGTKTVTTENADGSKTTEETKKDGTKVTTQTNAHGETTAEVIAKGETEVIIPVYDAKEVTKVVVTDKDRVESEVEFEVKDGGIAISVSGNSTVSVQTGHICYAKDFTDVDLDAWYHLNIDYVLEKGLFKGTTKTTFAPNADLTRAMLVTVLYRAEGEPAVNRSIPFGDVDMGAYYGNAVSWAKQNGIVKGVSETEFAPDDNITREQIAAIMHRYAQYKGYDVSVGESTNILSYDDFDNISEYAIAAMQYACGSGLIKGKSESTLNPLDNATRAEVAAIIHRFIEFK